MEHLRFRLEQSLATLALLLSSCAATSHEMSPPPTLGIAPTPLDSPASSSDQAPPPAATVEPAPPPRVCQMFSKPGVLRRTDLVRLIDAGLPLWLQGVQGDRVLANHRFQGWVIKTMYAGDPCYQVIDLRSGDIVQKINGKSIEKPEQAFDVAQSLRTAPTLVVDYLRDGKVQRMTLSIADE
jgi:S1-C subfamily serine protease